VNLIEEDTNFRDSGRNKYYSEYKKFLLKHFMAGDYYKKFYVSDDDNHGVVFEISAEKNEKVLFTEGMANRLIQSITRKTQEKESLIIEEVIKDHAIESAIYMGAPVFDASGTLLGSVIVELNIDAINAIMYENNPHNGLGKSGEAYLVGKDLLMRSTSRFQENSVFKTRVNTAGVLKALKGETGTEVIADYRGVTVLSAYSKVNLHGLDWVILAEIDKSEAMIPIMSIRNNIIYISILITLLLFVLVYLVAQRISQPIIRLKHAAEKITDGNYEVTVEHPSTNDEVDNLVDAFNDMSKKIKEQTENLKLERSMRLSSMLDGQELERQRLSRELHDGLGQSILAIRMRLDRMSMVSQARAKEIAGEVQELITVTIKEVRSISNNLMPAVLNDFGLEDALKNLCDELNEIAGVDISCICEEKSSWLSERQKTYLYRIAQEALNNILKHANASKADLSIRAQEESMTMTISDNGTGFEYYEGKRLCGNGISNIKERVHLLGGDVLIHSNSKEGTKISIKIPRNRK
jgi:signal transduction histidine kinase